MLAVVTLAVVAFFVPAALAIRNAQQRQDLLELSQEEVAKLSGLTRQRTNRALHELEDAGLLQLAGGDLSSLQQLDGDRPCEA